MLKKLMIMVLGYALCAVQVAHAAYAWIDYYTRYVTGNSISIGQGATQTRSNLTCRWAQANSSSNPDVECVVYKISLPSSGVGVKAEFKFDASTTGTVEWKWYSQDVTIVGFDSPAASGSMNIIDGPWYTMGTQRSSSSMFPTVCLLVKWKPSDIRYNTQYYRTFSLRFTTPPLELSRIAISGDSYVDSGGSIDYACVAYMSDGSMKTISPTWSIDSGASYASISSSGVLTAYSTTVQRNVTIKASYTEGGITKTTYRDVRINAGPPTLSSVSITGSANVNSGGSSTYSCLATLSDDTTKTVSPTWSIDSGASYASISSSGVLTAYSTTVQRNVTIKASYTEGGVTKTATKSVTIDAATPTPSSISISGPSSVNFGESASYTCSAALSDGTTKTVVPSWFIVSGDKYATISASGILTASNTDVDGTVGLFAVYTEDGVTLSTLLTVTVLARDTEPEFTVRDGCLTKVVLNDAPDVVIPNGVTSIGYGAFCDCTNMVSVTIPSGVTAIGDCAFQDCAALREANLPQGLKSIGSGAFSWCGSLESIAIPESVTNIGYAAFCNCESLVSANIPSDVRVVEASLFADCLSLTSVVISEGVVEIAPMAFQDCLALANINLPSTLKNIGWSAFDLCGLERIDIPVGVTNIGESAFAWCPIETVVIPASVTTIGNGAFFGCRNLETVEINAEVSVIGENAFGKCGNLSSVTVKGALDDYETDIYGVYVSENTPATLTTYVTRAWTGPTGKWLNRNVVVNQVPPLQYTVVLDANGGMVSGQPSVSAQVEQGKYTNQAAGNRTVTHTGYVLVGWYDTNTASGGNMVFNARGYAVNGIYWNGAYSPGVSAATWKFSGDVTAYARWVAAPPCGVVTFDANGGAIGNESYSCVVVERGKYTMQAGASGTKTTRSGYTLVGWYDAKSGGDMVFDARGYAVNGIYWNGAYSPGVSAATWKYASGVTAYARWVESSTHRVVTFDANGGAISNATSCAVVEQGKYTSQAGASILNAFRSGYTLRGWYDAKSGGNMVFDARGYAVNGKYWNGSYSPSASSATWKHAGNVTAYAQWVATPPYRIVTFDANGGALGNASCNCVVEQGKYTSQAGASVMKATRSGYTLVGWYDAKSGGNMVFDARGYAVNGKYWNGAYSPGVSAATWKGVGNVTAYARWVANTPYRVVTFDANGGMIGNASYAAVVVEDGKYTMQAGAAGTGVTRSGYTLRGWYDAKSGGNMVFDARGYAVNGKYWNGAYSQSASAATWKYAGNVTAYAQWVATPPYRIVTFDANGGVLGNATCNCVVEQGKYTSQAGASVMNATRTGYTLVGWYDAKTGGNMVFNAQGYAVNGTYWNGSYVPSKSSATWKYDGSVTAYARWVSASGNIRMAVPSGNMDGDFGSGDMVEAEAPLFFQGEYEGTFADDDGRFMLTLDEGLETAYFVTWTDDGGVACECEAAVADDVLILTTETGEVYHLVWDEDDLVAMRE